MMPSIKLRLLPQRVRQQLPLLPHRHKLHPVKDPSEDHSEDADQLIIIMMKNMMMTTMRSA